jgi:hypothetical protein
MTTRNHDLHGNAPDKSDVALLLIDVINDLEFEGGEKLLQQALPMARRLADLLDRLVPDWSHSVRGIVQIGDFVAATAAITINRSSYKQC